MVNEKSPVNSETEWGKIQNKWGSRSSQQTWDLRASHYKVLSKKTSGNDSTNLATRKQKVKISLIYN